MNTLTSLRWALAALALSALPARAGTPTFTSFATSDFIVHSNTAPWTITANRFDVTITNLHAEHLFATNTAWAGQFAWWNLASPPELEGAPLAYSGTDDLTFTGPGAVATLSIVNSAGALLSTGLAGVDALIQGGETLNVYNSAINGVSIRTNEVAFIMGVNSMIVHTNAAISTGNDTNRWIFKSVTEGASTNIVVNINGKDYTFQAW